MAGVDDTVTKTIVKGVNEKGKFMLIDWAKQCLVCDRACAIRLSVGAEVGAEDFYTTHSDLLMVGHYKLLGHGLLIYTKNVDHYLNLSSGRVCSINKEGAADAPLMAFRVQPARNKVFPTLLNTKNSTLMHCKSQDILSFNDEVVDELGGVRMKTILTRYLESFHPDFNTKEMGIDSLDKLQEGLTTLRIGSDFSISERWENMFNAARKAVDKKAHLAAKQLGGNTSAPVKESTVNAVIESYLLPLEAAHEAWFSKQEFYSKHWEHRKFGVRFDDADLAGDFDDRRAAEIVESAICHLKGSYRQKVFDMIVPNGDYSLIRDLAKGTVNSTEICSPTKTPIFVQTVIDESLASAVSLGLDIPKQDIPTPPVANWSGKEKDVKKELIFTGSAPSNEHGSFIAEPMDTGIHNPRVISPSPFLPDSNATSEAESEAEAKAEPMDVHSPIYNNPVAAPAPTAPPVPPVPPPAKEPPIIMAKETPPVAEPDVKDRPNGKDILNEDDPMHDSFFKSVIEETPEAIYNHFKVKVKKPLEAKGGISSSSATDSSSDSSSSMASRPKRNVKKPLKDDDREKPEKKVKVEVKQEVGADGKKRGPGSLPGVARGPYNKTKKSEFVDLLAAGDKAFADAENVSAAATNAARGGGLQLGSPEVTVSAVAAVAAAAANATAVAQSVAADQIAEVKRQHTVALEVANKEIATLRTTIATMKSENAVLASQVAGLKSGLDDERSRRSIAVEAAIGGCNKDKGDAVTAAFKEGQASMLDLMAKMNTLNKP